MGCAAWTKARVLEGVDNARPLNAIFGVLPVVFREQGAMKMTEQQTRTTQQISTQLKALHFGGNWTSSNLKDKLADITWQQATKQ